ncbi:hypothetical protein GALL_318920 [mine drainage metagenome]|uniref:DUF1684 domain-containing protein n=1 Tax=mine drainage metagenome TaxID=410659 RepID=A0A1J5R9A2_9ZZZZ
MTTALLDVVDWRRRVFALYQQVRERTADDPAAAHALWCSVRDDLVGRHPASPLPPSARERFTGLRVLPYDPAYRFVVEIEPVPADTPPAGTRGGGTVAPTAPASVRAAVGDAVGASVREPGSGPLVDPTGPDGAIRFARVGRVALAGLGGLDVWSLRSYGGGLFLPVKDALAGDRTYGGGRYVLDTVKGADLGTSPDGTLVVDLNFAYNPSCAYDPAWTCPLPTAGNVLAGPVPAGELVPVSEGVGGAR